MASLNLDQLRAFAEVVERGSFSAAAEHLGLTQPAVSLRVRQLERALGLPLIERVGKRATPTAAGSELLTHAGRIQETVELALQSLAPYTSGTTGRVRLGTGATACIYLLPPILRDLRRRFPALELVVRTGNTADLVKLIEENRLDLGLVTMPTAGRAFEVTPVRNDDLVVIAPAGDESLPARVTAAVLANRPLVLYEPGGATRRIIDHWFARANLAVKPIMELGSVEAIKELVGAGLGYAILPSTALPADRERAALTVRPLAPALRRRLALVRRRDKPLHHGLQETITALQSISGHAGG